MNSSLSPYAILGIIAVYFAVLILISYLTSRDGNDNDSFFLAGRKSPWPLVAFGMVGASLSGVTFISVPGAVGAGGANQAFSYMQVVFGYLLGYLFIATVLLPLYYKLGLTSIYEYLKTQIGPHAYKVGAFYFLLSRTIGAAFRLFLVAIVLQEYVTGPLEVPFAATVAITILLIWVYTFRGGIKTIVYTDTLQTVCMLLAAGLTVYYVGQALETDLGGMIALIKNSDYSQVFFFEGGWTDPNNFWKQFLSGALITIVMTGLDQDMMQKNLSMPNFRDAQKNMAAFSFVLIFANLLFLALGALLYIYVTSVGLAIPEASDQLYPSVALQHLPPVAGVLFVLGLVAAAYSSADSALTALTTSFCVDFLGMNEVRHEDKSDDTTANDRKRRLWVHIGFSVLLFVVILIFRNINNDAIITELFKAAGYTYGPLLGLFAFGLFTNLKVREKTYFDNVKLALPLTIGACAVILIGGAYLIGGSTIEYLIAVTLTGSLLVKKVRERLFMENGRVAIPALLLVCLASPIISMVVDHNSAELLRGFKFGFLILAFNGLLTFLGLVALSDFGDFVPAPDEEA